MGDGQTFNGQAYTIIAVSAILSILAILAVVLRFYARTYKGSHYYLDDYLVLAALILTLGVTINGIVGVAVGGIGEHEDFRISGPAKGFPLAKELLPQGKVMYAMQILHTCAMPIIKASILAFYIRLFPTRRFKIAVFAVSIYVFCWWVSTFFVTIFQCHPVSYNWGTEPFQLGGCIQDINVFYETAAFLNMVGDVVVLALPFPLVGSLHMPIKHKMAVLGIFLTGALVIVASIGRTVAYFKDNYNLSDDFSYWYYSLVIWTSVEPTLGVISACLPTLRPLFSGMSPETLMGSIRSMLSLHSMRGNTANGEGTVSDDRQHLPSGAASAGETLNSRSHSGGGFYRLPDPNGSSKDNEDVARELYERKHMRKCMLTNGIVVQEDLDQKAIHDTHEMV